MGKVGNGVDIDRPVEDRGRVAEHISCCEGDARERGPAEGVVSGTIDAGAFAWDIDSSGAFHKPW